jgi:hypothetical protein
VGNWKSKLDEAFGAFRAYRPGKYIDQFPELRAVAQIDPEAITADDITVLLWKTRHVGDRRLVARYLPELTERYLQGRLLGMSTTLYANLLAWTRAWSRLEYDALTDALLLHWQDTVHRHSPPRLTVTTGEVAFLLLWLEDTAPVEPWLLNLAERYHRQEVEFEWDETWGSETWTPFINRVRATPVQSLLAYATGGELGWQEFGPNPERDARVASVLKKTGIALSS